MNTGTLDRYSLTWLNSESQVWRSFPASLKVGSSKLWNKKFESRMKVGTKKSTYRSRCFLLNSLAERTGLEPATPGVTGRYSNQLNYRSAAVYYLPERLASPRGFEPLYPP